MNTECRKIISSWKRGAFGWILISIAGFNTFSQQNTPIPHLEKRGQATQLIVDGKPFLVLGGELHNSSATSADYLRPLWSKLDTMHLNTVLTAITWELAEPQEGKYDFSLVDTVLAQARMHHKKVALLWFGSWKNGLSHYAPAWVKADYKRFPRMHIKANNAVESLTPLSEETMKADAKAFAAMMKHVKEIDNDHTVIMIQVQNEVGLLGDSRDRGALAEQAWSKPVPAALMSYLSKNKATLLPETQALWKANGNKGSGTWADVFGTTPAAEEAFMQWNYSHYINEVAAAGKREYSIPMFVNAWIVQPEDKLPGDYPSGGPQAHGHDFWKAAGSSIDILAPDIYLNNFDEITALYRRSGTPLFIPESKSDENGVANAFYAIGEHHALGYSPFGIDGSRQPKDLPRAPLTMGYSLLQEMSPVILDAQSKGTIKGFWFNTKQQQRTISMGDYKLDVSVRRNRTNTEKHDVGYGMIIATGPDEFTIVGKYLQVNFSPATAGPAYVGYSLLDEGTYKNGEWIKGRRLNGDDIMLNYVMSEEAAAKRVGSVVRTLGDGIQVMKVKLYRFE